MGWCIVWPRAYFFVCRPGGLFNEYNIKFEREVVVERKKCAPNLRYSSNQTPHETWHLSVILLDLLAAAHNGALNGNGQLSRV